MIARLWHQFQHRWGWWSGHVVSRSDRHGRIWIGFMCDKCCRITGEHDANEMITTAIEAHGNGEKL